MLPSGDLCCWVCQKQMRGHARAFFLLALCSLRPAGADERRKYELQPVQKTETFLQGDEGDFAKLHNFKYSKLLQTPLNDTHHFNKEEGHGRKGPLETLSQWHVHRFNSGNLRSSSSGEKPPEGADRGGSVREESTQVILHCFDCDTDPPAPSWQSAANKQKENFFFHKVNVDTTYDPFTKRPYHNSILAVKAVPQVLLKRTSSTSFRRENISASQSAKDETTKTNRPYFTFQNRSNQYRINSVNFKPILTDPDDTDFDEGEQTYSTEYFLDQPRSHRSREENMNRNHHSHKTDNPNHFRKSKHHKTSKRYNKKKSDHHHHHHRKIHKNSVQNQLRKSTPNVLQDDKRNMKGTAHKIQNLRGKTEKRFQLDEFPEQVAFLHRWLLKLDHQSYQKALQRESSNLRLLTSASREKNS